MRRAARARRAALSPRLRRLAAHRAARQLLRRTRSHRRIAIYLAAGSELDTAPLAAALARRGVSVFVPVLRRDFLLRFVPLGRGPLRRNAHGIFEPAQQRPALTARALDLIVMPLVAFDACGHRAGSGAGYYDRALARPRPYRRPLRVGYAFAEQEVARVPASAHDQPLDAVVTAAGWRRLRGAR